MHGRINTEFAVVAVNHLEMIALPVSGMSSEQVDQAVHSVSGRDYRYQVFAETEDEAVDVARADGFAFA